MAAMARILSGLVLLGSALVHQNYSFFHKCHKIAVYFMKVIKQE
jgi:hypothetical protein